MKRISELSEPDGKSHDFWSPQDLEAGEFEDIS